MEPSKGVESGRNILIALDYTDESVRTVKWALGQHAREGDRVTLLHVQPEHTPAVHQLPGPGPFAALHEREQEQRRRRCTEERQVERRIHAWAQHYCPSGIQLTWHTAQVPPATVAMAGDGAAARDCILSEAGRLKADCLIVGSHRHTKGGGLSDQADSAGGDAAGPYSVSQAASAMAALGWKGLTLGGVMATSEYCSQNAPCPVIVVPPPTPSPLDASCAVAAVASSVPVSTPVAFLDSLAL